jgi:guanylate kinase
VSLSRPAFPVVLAAPSGAGKTTLVRMLLERHPDLAFAISATTRPPRPREQDGRDYHFVDDATFDRMIETTSWSNGPSFTAAGTVRPGAR